MDPHPSEARRGTTGNGVSYRYLKRASYANTDMFQNPDTGGTGAFRFHLVFDYGDHDADDPGISPDQTWPARQDAFSNFRAGFDVPCYRLCQRVLMFHSFSSLRALEGDPVPVVVKALSLSYTERPTVTTLDQAQRRGGYGAGEPRVAQGGQQEKLAHDPADPRLPQHALDQGAAGGGLGPGQAARAHRGVGEEGERPGRAGQGGRGVGGRDRASAVWRTRARPRRARAA